MQLQFQANNAAFNISIDPKQGEWFLQILPQLSVGSSNGLTIAEIKASYQAAGLEGFELFWDNKPINTLSKAGLLRV